MWKFRKNKIYEILLISSNHWKDDRAKRISDFAISKQRKVNVTRVDVDYILSGNKASKANIILVDNQSVWKTISIKKHKIKTKIKVMPVDLPKVWPTTLKDFSKWK